MFDPNGLRRRYRLLDEWNGRWINYWTETVPEHGATPSSEQNVSEEHSLLLSRTADIPIFEDASLSTPRSAHERSLVTTDSDAVLSDEGKKEAERRYAKEIKDEKKALEKQKKLEKKHKELRPARHFIILPLDLSFGTVGAGEHWEKVRMAGVEDEVGAHCGLFIKDQNVEYDALVKRVGGLISGWCLDGLDRSC